MTGDHRDRGGEPPADEALRGTAPAPCERCHGKGYFVACGPYGAVRQTCHVCRPKDAA